MGRPTDVEHRPPGSGRVLPEPRARNKGELGGSTSLTARGFGRALARGREARERSAWLRSVIPRQDNGASANVRVERHRALLGGHVGSLGRLPEHRDAPKQCSRAAGVEAAGCRRLEKVRRGVGRRLEPRDVANISIMARAPRVFCRMRSRPWRKKVRAVACVRRSAGTPGKRLFPLLRDKGRLVR